MHEKGFNNTGLQEILREAGIAKGSFYFYFKNKEDFGLQVVDAFFTHFADFAHQYFNDDSLSHVMRIKNFFNEFLDFFVNGDYKGGCPIGNFTLEMADVNDKFREQLLLIVDKSTSLVADQILLAQNKGEISNLDNPHSLAEFIFFTWEGMIMQMKLSRNTIALEQFNYHIFQNLLYKTEKTR